MEEDPSATDEPTGSTQLLGNPNGNFWLYRPNTGFDLTHPSKPCGPPVRPRIRLSTATEPITIAPKKTALIIIDMQNYFLSSALGIPRGAGHKAEDTLLSTGIPAARKGGIQVVHVTWGISDDDLATVTPNLFRGFGFVAEDQSAPKFDVVPGGRTRENQALVGLGEDMGRVTYPDGTTVEAGRKLMRDQWNTALHGPLQRDFDESQTSALPHLRFQKTRISGFWGGDAPPLGYLKENGFTTLLFTGVNTDQCVLASVQDVCNMGFDTVLLKDGCGTKSPDCAREMVEFNCRKTWGFLSSCKALAEGVDSMR